MKIIVLFSFISCVLISCNKENYGCTDPIAFNYDEEANIESGYCDYPDTLIAWFGINRSNIWKNEDPSITHFRIYFTEDYYSTAASQLIGEVPIDSFWVEKPAVDDPSALRLIIDNLYDIEYSARWILTDQNDNELTYDYIADFSEDGAYYTEL